MYEDIPVEREDDATGGRWVMRFPDGLEGEMTYRRLPGNVIAIDHTFTPPELRGNNLAARLMARAIADVRRDGARIHPICSYVVAQFRRHPDWADLLA